MASRADWSAIVARAKQPPRVLAAWNAERQNTRTQWLGTAVAAALARQTRRLESAETTHYTESWSGAQTLLNHSLSAGLGRMVARSRDLTRNNDHARGYMLQMRSQVLGPQGVMLQLRMPKRGGGTNTTVNDIIEGAWRRFGKRGVCDVSGRHTWHDIERLCLDSLVRDGEYLLRMVVNRGPHRFQLQLLDPLLLDPELNRDEGGTRIRLGVEINDEGRPLAYWLRASGKPDFSTWGGAYTVGRHVRVPAEEIIHRFVAEEPDQLRGYPWINAGARRLWLVKDYETSAAVASSNAAKRVGFFVSPNGESPPGMADQIVSSVLEQAKAQGKQLTPDEVQALVAVAEKHSTTVPGQFDTLPDGYDFRPFESEYPHTNYGDYIKECVRAFASGVGMSYVTAGNNLEAVNFSSARVGIVAEREHLKGVQQFLVDGLHADVFAAWLPWAMLAERALASLDIRRLPEYLDAAGWQPRRWPGIDPVKEADANEKNLANSLTSRRRLILERGEDPDEVFDEIEAEAARFGRPGAAPAAQAPGPTAGPEEEADDDAEPAAAKARAPAYLRSTAHA